MTAHDRANCGKCAVLEGVNVSAEKRRGGVFDVGAVYEGVNELREREFPSLAKEGAAKRRGGSIKKSIT